MGGAVVHEPKKNDLAVNVMCHVILSAVDPNLFFLLQAGGECK